MKSFFARLSWRKVMKYFSAFVFGAVAAVAFLFVESGDPQLITPGAISAGKADTFARTHYSHWPASWRMNSHGMWYDSGRINKYIANIDEFNSASKVITDSINKVRAETAGLGYEWKVAISFGAGRQKVSDDRQMMVIFMPALIYKEIIKEDTVCHTLNVFKARRYWKNKDDEKPEWEKKKQNGLTYAYLYEIFFAKYDTKEMSDGKEVFFDDGNMFP